ncbi:DUF2986 domain-containing protein [Oceanicoccus sagamiensis]|uniref:DUF2986 domain-containing protein n=1 Tax=Oceanicoccus sagamiensis TaxID=716816 RepID=A0A1X9NF30_9GAMM|nr:DUF2986 domain-containing protein [Oceanicoccus sagamiensis]ARN75771.1 DUF2986 domain-containing protein [Oceanicoccus sagamiensis]
MNRKKRINKILTQKAKKANTKNNPKNKARYISKAERAALEQQQKQQEESQPNDQ